MTNTFEHNCKAACIDAFITKYWGSELGEKLWLLSCQCVNDKEMADLYDKYLEQMKSYGWEPPV